MTVLYNENGIPIGTFSDEGMVRTSFGDWIDRAHAVTFQPDGKLVVAGQAVMDEEDILNFDFALLRFEVGSYSPLPRRQLGTGLVEYVERSGCQPGGRRVFHHCLRFPPMETHNLGTAGRCICSTNYVISTVTASTFFLLRRLSATIGRNMLQCATGMPW